MTQTDTTELQVYQLSSKATFKILIETMNISNRLNCILQDAI